MAFQAVIDKLLRIDTDSNEATDTLASTTWPKSDDANGTAADPAVVTAIVGYLESNTGTFPAATTAQLEALATFLEGLGVHPKLSQQLRKVSEFEQEMHPNDQGLQYLDSRVPRFERFTDEVRNLADEYDLAVVVDQVDPALDNLAQLASLDLRQLRDKIVVGETGTAQDLIGAANGILKERFAAWTQKPPVTVAFDYSGMRLLVHVKSGTGVSMRIRERSDGLRQFVALVALTAQSRHVVPPILLIDELEMHLHYDAQADLIRVLGQQVVASQVIYTTHSAAALPEDLGSSVRVVRGIDDETASEVRPQFWSEEPGMGALLLAMGAGALAFVPLRPALIAEGGSELILLPSLIKEALDVDTLGFQVVPGAASVPPTRIAGLDLQGVRSAWILDGDKSGRDRQKFLVKSGIPAGRIVLLGSAKKGVDLEDLIDPHTYVYAVNAYAKDVACEGELLVTELPKQSCARHRTVEAWFGARGKKPPSKTAIAGKVIEQRGSMALVSATQRPVLRNLGQSLRKLLQIDL